MTASVVEAVGLSKRFILRPQAARSIKDRLLRPSSRAGEPFWALRDVELAVAPGETVGVVGPNGSGKSTLLKCLAGVLDPTSGTTRTGGRLAALLELGAGFHPDLTGRENIVLNGLILGLSKKQVRTRLDAIVDFAELDQFIDTQVKFYSSGMYVRLGFAVAVHVDPEIMLVDEVLSVGDQSFRARCEQRLDAFREAGGTVLLVSHNPVAVQAMCSRVLVLDRGRVVAEGDPASALAALDRVFASRDPHTEAWPGPQPSAGGGLELTGIEVVTGGRAGRDITVRVAYRRDPAAGEVVFVLVVGEHDGVAPLFSTDTRALGGIGASGEVRFRLHDVPLAAGEYVVSVGGVAASGVMLGRLVMPFTIAGDRRHAGPVLIRTETDYRSGAASGAPLGKAGD